MSSLAESQLEEILITLERTYLALPTIRLIALEQQLAQIWMLGPRGCTVSFSGTLTDCSTAATLPSVVVSVKDAGSGSTYATATTDGSGNFSGSFTISGSSVNVNLTTPALTCYSSSSTPFTLSCGSNTGLNICATPAPNTTVTGTIKGCKSGTNLGSGNAVTVTNGATTLWSGTTAAGGVYTATFCLTSNTTLTITCTPTSTRDVATSITPTITAGVTNSGKDITPTPASGYTCSSMCALPLSTTVTLTVTSTCDGFGWAGDTLTYNASPPAWASSGAGVWIGNDFTLNGPFGNGTYTYVMAQSGVITAHFNHTGTSYSISSSAAQAFNQNATCPTNGGGAFSATSSCGAGVNVVGSLSA